MKQKYKALMVVLVVGFCSCSDEKAPIKKQGLESIKPHPKDKTQSMCFDFIQIKKESALSNDHLAYMKKVAMKILDCQLSKGEIEELKNHYR